MAAPPEITMKDFRGFWGMNKTLSDPLEPALALQGIPWILRKLINLATITMFVKQDVNDSGIETITIDQTASGGIKAETEVRKLDWSEITTISAIFGTTHHRAKWVNIADGESREGGPLDSWLTEGWLEERDSTANKWLLDVVENKKAGWFAEQLWGFALINGERYHIRKTLVRKGDEVAKARTVYEWKGLVRN